MAKVKHAYACRECGASAPKWAGQCADCGEWNTLTEIVITATNDRFQNYAGAGDVSLTSLANVPAMQEVRIQTGLDELDRVLGGGLVTGSVILIGGDPGIGKSTLLLQTLSHLSEHHKALYVTGEESLQQVKLRAQRLGLEKLALDLLTETSVESILATAQQVQPAFMVLDSIQTMYTTQIQAAPGSITQVRESTAQLVRFAKQTGTAVLLVGHVTKDGAIAGPRVLEHMVDTVLYFEGDPDGRFRMLRAVKNRFGAVNELGIFAMTDKGLKEINNPSAIFLSRSEVAVCGSVVMVTWEGSRPMLIEIQALVDESHLGNPRRVTVGLDQNRLALILAVLHRHAGVISYNQDIFVNVVGGVRVTETGIDLAAALAVVSSLKNKPLPNDLVVFGEIGLSGEIRPVQSGQDRLKEAVKLGFTQAIVPKANAPKKDIAGL
ncbi:MAG TPA: DNA repair protein RadA, partial [Gammaproteobacteria bacterium]|nr:DNA repair protein RadA [Gammaproteobacteria bacterium]